MLASITLFILPRDSMHSPNIRCPSLPFAELLETGSEQEGWSWRITIDINWPPDITQEWHQRKENRLEEGVRTTRAPRETWPSPVEPRGRVWLTLSDPARARTLSLRWGHLQWGHSPGQALLLAGAQTMPAPTALSFPTNPMLQQPP